MEVINNKNGIAQFSKVSYETFNESALKFFQSEKIQAAYDNITLPKRGTRGSAGYDFISPFDFELKPHESITIPTGIRCKMDDGWVLQCYPRSGLGFKYRLQLNNTVGIIDSDYFYSDNEGHIMIKVTNDSNENKTLKVKAGDRIMQGIFVQYGITIDDNVTDVRNGGFGSTDRSQLPTQQRL